jgi:integrase/recombinase XerC
MASANYLTEFTQYLTTEKRYSSHTIRAYIDDLNQFWSFTINTFEINDAVAVKATYIRSWLSSLKDDEITSKTINRKISSLKTYYKFLQKKEIVLISPLVNITAPKISKRLPQFVAEKDIKLLLQHIPFPEGYTGVLDKSIITLFYFTGMRLSELQYLDYSNINITNKTLKVLGKGNKERLLPIVPELLIQLEQYIIQRATIQNASILKELFLLPSGKPLYAKYIYNIVNHYLQFVTTINKKSPHILRHSFATHLTNNGAELNAVKELLGHSSLAATQIYTHNSIEKLKNAHKNAHPKA